MARKEIRFIFHIDELKRILENLIEEKILYIEFKKDKLEAILK